MFYRLTCIVPRLQHCIRQQMCPGSMDAPTNALILSWFNSFNCTDVYKLHIHDCSNNAQQQTSRPHAACKCNKCCNAVIFKAKSASGADVASKRNVLCGHSSKYNLLCFMVNVTQFLLSLLKAYCSSFYGICRTHTLILSVRPSANV